MISHGNALPPDRHQQFLKQLDIINASSSVLVGKDGLLKKANFFDSAIGVIKNIFFKLFHKEIFLNWTNNKLVKYEAIKLIAEGTNSGWIDDEQTLQKVAGLAKKTGLVPKKNTANLELSQLPQLISQKLQIQDVSLDALAEKFFQNNANELQPYVEIIKTKNEIIKQAPPPPSLPIASEPLVGKPPEPNSNIAPPSVSQTTPGEVKSKQSSDKLAQPASDNQKETKENKDLLNQMNSYLQNQGFKLEDSKTNKYGSVIKEKGKSPLYVKIRFIDKESDPENWQDYALNFTKHSPEGYKNPKKIYIVEFRTSAQTMDDSNLTMVGLLSDQNAAYVGNMIVDKRSGWKSSDLIQKWEEMTGFFSTEVISLQDTAHLSIEDQAGNPIELSTRFYFPIIRQDGKNFYQRLGYEFEHQVIDIGDKKTYIDRKRYDQAYKNLESISLNELLEDNIVHLTELYNERKTLSEKEQHKLDFKIQDLELYISILGLYKILLMDGDQSIQMKMVISQMSKTGQNEKAARLLGDECLKKLVPNSKTSFKTMQPADLHQFKELIKKHLNLTAEHEPIVENLITILKGYTENKRNPNQELSTFLFHFIAINSSEDAQIVSKCDEFRKRLTPAK